MQRKTLVLAIAIVMLTLTAPAFAGRGNGGGGNGGGGNGGGPANNGCSGDGAIGGYLATLPVEELSDGERADLIWVREEEKLARDLYLLFAQCFAQRSFQQIARAEQSHMDLVAGMLTRYAVADPVQGRPMGLFADDQLQRLYDQLAVAGGSALVEALRVGALVEETDLADVAEMLAASDNRDLDVVYQNLAKGSRNHLRAYVGQLERYGVEYRPSILDEATFAAIVNADKERGPVDESGNPLPVPGGCGPW